ncbi:DNA-binding transcriptional LysR family regulator [Umezawaea tangerina]|uniref:DNA-binding transcriptional LysR family regulator n=2 Tax=Umezawaea tangerina TaxID=84725 RepID=A0A2T0SQW2_9PSEU|nr:DNA-binding transcriptional LysR family regulator [Umezawaea tangerina]
MILMRLEVRHLELVVAIAESGSLRKAAAHLHLTQPAVTTQLKRIEAWLGGPLFVRSTDGVLATHTGTELVRDAKKVLDQLADLERTARLNTQRESGTPLKVGGIPAQQFSLLVNVLAATRPRQEVTSRTVRETSALTALLGSGELDVAVMRRFPGFPLALPTGVEHRLMLSEPIFVGVHEGHPLAGRDEIALAELADEKWVMPDPDDSGMNEFVARACAAAGFEQRIAHLTNEAHIAFALTAEGRAVCQLYPIGTARDGLATLTLEGNPLHREIVLAWREDSPVASAVDELCREIEVRYRALVDTSPVYARWWLRGGADFALPRGA